MHSISGWIKNESAEEILCKNVPRIKNHANYEFILKSMVEFASQHHKEITLVSNEDIQNEAFNRARELNIKGNGQRVSFYNGFIEGVKAILNGQIPKK